MSVLDLTTVDRVIAYMGTANSGASAGVWSEGNKSIIAGMISTVSQDFENYCNRLFKSEERTVSEILDGDTVFLPGVPIASVPSVSASTSGRVSDMLPLASTEYDILPSADGVVFYSLARGARVSITYTGGLAATTAALIAAHPVLAGKCELQVAMLWRRHNTADKTGMTLGNGNTSWSAEYKMLEDVSDTLDNEYMRVSGFL